MKKQSKSAGKEKDKRYPLPKYPAKDDIYNTDKEEPLEEDEITGKISTKKKKAALDMDLDVPGAEADDKNELVGEEDEENNYYSLGGDNHNDLEE
ncbi:MAG: hypothetical protein ABUT20_39170, partial [Bacteroidota bacterium]